MPINRDDKTVRKDRRCDENGDGADERCVLFFTLLLLGAPETRDVDPASIPTRRSV